MESSLPAVVNNHSSFEKTQKNRIFLSLDHPYLERKNSRLLIFIAKSNARHLGSQVQSFSLLLHNEANESCYFPHPGGVNSQSQGDPQRHAWMKWSFLSKETTRWQTNCQIRRSSPQKSILKLQPASLCFHLVFYAFVFIVYQAIT